MRRPSTQTCELRSGRTLPHRDPAVGKILGRPLPSMRKERISFSFSSRLMWIALSGSSPCSVRTGYLSVSSQPLPGPILPSCPLELGWKLRPPNTEDATLRKARQLCLFWDISTFLPVGSSPACVSCESLSGKSPWCVFK